MIVLVTVGLRGDRVDGAPLRGRGDVVAETTSNDVDSCQKFEDAAFARDFFYLLRQNRATPNNKMQYEAVLRLKPPVDDRLCPQICDFVKSV